MKPNKKLLMSFMALNAVMSSNAGASAVSKPLEYERLYNKMVKNLELNKSNSKNHKLLEQILNKRNKELQELYIQGDYIVKPEYLEWQIFFSGFYNEKQRGDNTLDNAKYYAFPETAGNKNTISGEIYNSILGSGVSKDALQSILKGNKTEYEKL